MVKQPLSAGRRRPERQTSAAGFTLLETLVVLAVLGLLLGSLLQVNRFVLLGSDAHSRLLGQNADLDAVDRTLRSLIAQARPGSEREPLVFAGFAHAVIFTSVMPISTSEFHTRRADLKIAVDSSHRLMLVWTPHLHAIRIGRSAPTLSTEILQGVERIDLAYLSAGPGGRWTSIWQDAVPPRLVRVRIVFLGADHPIWPDILAAPMLDAM